MTWLHKELLAQARRHPDRPAIDPGKTGTIGYAQLLTIVGALKAEIAAAEAPRAIGVLSNRRAEAYCAVLAAFFSGVKFVPLNPGFPAGRLAKIVALAEVDLILCDSSSVETASGLGAHWRNITSLVESPPAIVAAMADRIETDLAIDARAIAYQMFTSGSTGEPKGVPVPYGALNHYVRHIRDLVPFPDTARFSQLFDLSFDLAIHDIFVALACGGTIVPAGPIDLMMPHSYIEKRQIDVWFSVPMLAMVTARGAAAPKTDHRIKVAQFCGEALPIDYVRRFRPYVADDGPVFNLYGPTEATIAITGKALGAEDDAFAVAPLGDPFGDNKIAILDDDGAVVAPSHGGEGELLLGGPQVFAGYEPARDPDPFVTHDGIRYYRSGDRVRFADGELHHLGRIDGQVKLRGLRIELGEIEAAFRDAFGCEAAAAIVVGEQENAEIRVAYQRDADIDDIAPLKSRLPDYMIPKRTWRRDDLPVNVNGKVDRKALAQMPWPDA